MEGEKRAWQMKKENRRAAQALFFGSKLQELVGAEGKC